MAETKLLSDSLIEVLQNQYCSERFNNSLYLRIASALAFRGFDKTYEVFLDQAAEEIKHSLYILKLLTDLNVDYSIGEIDSGDFTITLPSDISDKFVEREVETTESLTAIRDLAINDPSPAAPLVEGAMREMLMWQIKETEECTTFQDRVNLSGNNWFNLYLLLEK